MTVQRKGRKLPTCCAVHVTVAFPTDGKIALIFRWFVLSDRYILLKIDAITMNVV